MTASAIHVRVYRYARRGRARYGLRVSRDGNDLLAREGYETRADAERSAVAAFGHPAMIHAILSGTPANNILLFPTARARVVLSTTGRDGEATERVIR